MRQIDLSAPNPLSCKRGVRKSITRIACRFLRGIFVKSDRLLASMQPSAIKDIYSRIPFHCIGAC